MKRIVFIEGLPGVGKTTLVTKLKNYDFVKVVDEVINPDSIIDRTKYYLKNDEMKLNMYDDGLIVIDRGLLSTISYEQAKHIINKNYNNDIAIEWFDKNKNIYQDEDISVIYLKRTDDNYYLPYSDQNDPFGSVDNQKLLESITLYNLKKYSSNYKIVDYKQEQMEAIIDEIIS